MYDWAISTYIWHAVRRVGSELGIEPEPRDPPPPFQEWDEIRLRVRSCGEGLKRHTHGALAKRLMHIVHLSGNTSGVLKLSSDWLNSTGFPGDMCVMFFNVPPGNKDAMVPNSLTKEESSRVHNCDDKCGSNKRWIFKSMWNRILNRIA